MINSNDLKIIKRLMEHARTTWAELGTLLGLSGPAAADRVGKLRGTGDHKRLLRIDRPRRVRLWLRSSNIRHIG